MLGQNVRLASAEGLILTKLIGFRPQDQADIQDLFDAYSTSLDLKFVRNELASVASVDDLRWGFLERCEREAAP